MENRPLFLAFLAAWCVYIVAIHIVSARLRCSLLATTASHFAATVTAFAMGSIFLVGGGATVAQLAAGSEPALDLWSLWFHLWPFLLFLTGGSAIVNFLALLIVPWFGSTRRYLAIIVPGLAISALAFMAVLANFPDA